MIIKRVLSALLRPQVQDRAANFEQVLRNVLGLPSELSCISVDEQSLLLLLKQCTHLHGLLHQSLFANKVQLVEHVNKIYLIRLLNLGLNDRAKLVIELFDQESIAPFIDIFQDALIGLLVGDSVSMKLHQILLVLLVYGLLVKHEESRLPLSGAHDTRPIVQFGGEEPFAIRSLGLVEIATPGGVQKRQLAPVHVAHIVIT